jgi:putative protease
MKTSASKPEILAPAGNMQSFQAACYAGADAVYLGLDRFSARGSADNFRFDELKQVVMQSRLFGVKVYLALNTLVFDDELPDLREYVKNAASCGINAVIVQDFGVAAAVRESAPEIQLHASTQMTVNSVEGARLLKNLGFSRVVLARELKQNEVRRITAQSGIETEIFVHGAHCVSVSGQCYMSSLMGGSIARSGNRGMCAQPCRLDFRDGDNHYALSLKDLSLIGHIGQLTQMGVTSLKIEGRMKRPEYVAAAVDACRTALAGEPADMKLLADVFSRSGFTDGYFTGNYADMLGVRTKEDVLAAGEVLQKIKNRFKTPVKRYDVDFDVRVKADSTVCITRAKGLTVTVAGDVAQKAVTKSIDGDFVKMQMSKLGGTIFSLNSFECEVEPGLSLSASQINRLRRESIEQISLKIAEGRVFSPSEGL